MNQEQFAEKVLGVSRGHWNAVLGGRRNLDIIKAKAAAEEMDTEISLWTSLNPNKRKRAIAWRKYKRKELESQEQ